MKTQKIILFAFIAANLSYALGFNCLNKRFSREMEFLLMNQCMGSYEWMSEEQYKQKLNACSCYLGSLACEYDGDDEKLNKAAESKNIIENDEKKYQSCLENKESKGNGKMLKVLTEAVKAGVKEYLGDKN